MRVWVFENLIFVFRKIGIYLVNKDMIVDLDIVQFLVYNQYDDINLFLSYFYIVFLIEFYCFYEEVKDFKNFNNLICFVSRIIILVLLENEWLEISNGDRIEILQMKKIDVCVVIGS